MKDETTKAIEQLRFINAHIDILKINVYEETPDIIHVSVSQMPISVSIPSSVFVFSIIAMNGECIMMCRLNS